MWTFIDCAIQSAVAFNRNHPLLLNNNLRSNINHKLQLNNNRNNLKKHTEKKIQAGWCIEDFIGNFANKTTATRTTTTGTATRSSSPSLSSLLSCFNQLTTVSSQTSVLSSSNNSNNISSSNDHYPSPSSASSAKKTNLFYHHRKAFRRKEDNSISNLQQIVANITIMIAISVEYLLLAITNNLTFTTASLVGSTNFQTAWS